VAFSRVSSTMFTTSGVLLVLARTGSTAVAGVTAAAAVLPAAFTGPLLGAWLDVARSRRVLIVIDQLASVAALAALLALAGHAADWTLPAAAVLYSLTRPFSSGSFYSALADIAGPELIDEASKVESVSLNLSFVIGPALAGTLAGAAGPALAVQVQAGATLLVAVLIAANPVFDARPPERLHSARQAFAEGMRALAGERVLRAAGSASMLATFGWGMMNIGFPLYAVRLLHDGAHASGYMWAAVAAGSIIGTFVLAGQPSLRRIGLSYLVLGLSALAWPLAHVLWLGVGLIGVTGFLEGPAYSGTVALRQRHAPAAVRAQIMTTLGAVNLVAVSAGAAIAGAVDAALPLIIAFAVVNGGAALAAGHG
jgi:MFS family permease